MRILTGLAAFFCCTIASAQPASGVFEQVGSRPAWRVRTGAGEMLILPDGFLLRRGRAIRRFAWDRSMRLQTLLPAKAVACNIYVLPATSGDGGAVRCASGIRAFSANHKATVNYYIGPRGLEFDVEIQPGVLEIPVRLYSVDGDFSVDIAGRLAVAGETLSLKPVAYQEGARGHRKVVPVNYHLEDGRHVRFEIGAHDPKRRLTIDPVMTYATYFAGSSNDFPLGLRELPDGSVLLAGNTSSVDLPQGVSLNSVLMEVSAVEVNQQCFIARVAPVKKEIYFTSYFGGPGFNSCTALDLDTSGRILLAGVSEGSPSLATGGAQYSLPMYTVDGFLAQISADGKTLNYATYLNIDVTQSQLFMRAGPGDTVYLALSCGNYICGGPSGISGGYNQTPSNILLLRYNIAAKGFDQETYFESGHLIGIEQSPPGGVYLFGETASQNLPLQHAIQTTPPTASWAGFVAEISSDFRTLLFSSYLGGQNSTIQSALVNPDGSVWLSGITTPGSIPGLTSSQPAQPDGMWPFAVRVAPGSAAISQGVLADTSVKYLSGAFPSATGASGFVLANGRFCFASGTWLGCTNDAGNVLQTIPRAAGTDADPVVLCSCPGILVAPSGAGGVWTLDAVNPWPADLVPFDFKGAAIEPFPPRRSASDYSDLLLRYIDLSTPKPLLAAPQPVGLIALQTNNTAVLNFAGQNFAIGMALLVQNTQIPLSVTGPTTATVAYKSPSLPTEFPGITIPLAAGTYTGQLVNPIQGQSVMSDPFPVIVRNLPPAAQPFSTTSAPLTFSMVPPVYSDSQVTWNGTPLDLMASGPSGELQVQIPAGMAPAGTSGELALVNQHPGGGEQRVSVSIGAASSLLLPVSNQAANRILADLVQADGKHKLLYTIVDGGNQWALTSYSLPDGTSQQKRAIDKGTAAAAIDLALSSDGSHLWFTDDSLRVLRFRTDTFEQDLQFQLPADGFPPGGGNGYWHSLRALDDSPDSVLVATLGGRLIIYDRDQPRPYDSAEFPSVVTAAIPLLATSSYVYAVQRPDVYHPIPCVARYSIDNLGFGLPEEFCNPGANWGKYPEMKTYAGALVLDDASSAFGILQHPESGTGDMRSVVSFNPSQNVAVVGVSLGFDLNSRTGTYRLAFSRLDTGEPIGHYPPGAPLDAYPGPITLLDDGTMLYRDLLHQVLAIVPQWQNAIQQYP